MADEPECTLRRRRTLANAHLPLNVDVDYQVMEGDPDLGTPTPSQIRSLANTKMRSSSSALLEFKNKQQSFDVQVEECEEEEIIIESDEEAPDEDGEEDTNRPSTPTPVQDFAANVVYTEGPQTSDFLKVIAAGNDCYTDVSDADTEEEE